MPILCHEWFLVTESTHWSKATVLLSCIQRLESIQAIQISCWLTEVLLMLWESKAGCPKICHNFEFNLLNKQQMQKGQSDLPLFSWKQEISRVKGTSLNQGLERHLYHQRQRTEGKKNLYEQILLLLLNYYQAQILFRILYWLKLPNMSFPVLSIPYRFMSLCLKCEKATCPAHFFGSQFYYWASMHTELNFWVFLLFICFMSIYFLHQVEENCRAEESFFLPQNIT